MAKAIKLTNDGLKKLQDELEYLKTTGRAEIAEKIKIARGYGDLSENSEYDEAKNEQAKIEARIVDLEVMLNNYELITDTKGRSKTVQVGSKVKVLDVEFEEEMEFKIVGSSEANPDGGYISDESPVGSALIGAKAGDKITVEVHGEEIHYEVISVSK